MGFRMKSFFFYLLLQLLLLDIARAEGPTLQFIIDENFLITHTLNKNTNKLPQHILKFRKDLKFQYSKEVLKLLDFKDMGPSALLIKIKNVGVGNLFTGAKAHPDYTRILQETQGHLNEVKREWESNFSKTYQFMKSITRINLDQAFNVFITHPEVFQGRNLGENEIAWGRKSDWKNYSSVYLWHEVLHSFLKFNSKSHALIELMTDDALKCALNGGTYPPFSVDGHPNLTDTKKQIYQKYWVKYLGDKKTNIIQLETIVISDKSFLIQKR